MPPATRLPIIPRRRADDVTRLTALLNRHVVPALTALAENTYMSAIRAGMVSVVPLTIIGGLFLVISYLPVPGWTTLVHRGCRCCRSR